MEPNQRHITGPIDRNETKNTPTSPFLSKSTFDSLAERGRECCHFDSGCDVIDTDCLQAEQTISIHMSRVAWTYVRTERVLVLCPTTLSPTACKTSIGRAALLHESEKDGNLIGSDLGSMCRCDWSLLHIANVPDKKACCKHNEVTVSKLQDSDRSQKGLIWSKLSDAKWCSHTKLSLFHFLIYFLLWLSSHFWQGFRFFVERFGSETSHANLFSDPHL